ATRLDAVGWARHRVADALLSRRNAHRIAIEQRGVDRRRKIRLVRQASPGDVAGVVRLHLRQQLRAHGGAQPVGGDEQVGIDALAAGETGRDLFFILFDLLQGHAVTVILLREYFLQFVIEALPRGHELRERALGDDAARLVERDARRKVDAERLLGHVRTRGAKAVGKSGENGDAGTAA